MLSAPKKPDRFMSSLLAKLISLVESDGPMRLNFEDLTGVTLDVPELALPPKNRFHVCEFCMLAKRTRRGHLGCNQNKNITNRLARKRGTGFVGQCHLGLTDIVEPLVYQGRTLGVFYYGSVLREKTRDLAERRIKRYCQRNELPPGALLRQLNRMPVIKSQDIEKARSPTLARSRSGPEIGRSIKPAGRTLSHVVELRLHLEAAVAHTLTQPLWPMSIAAIRTLWKSPKLPRR